MFRCAALSTLYIYNIKENNKNIWFEENVDSVQGGLSTTIML